MSDITLIPGGHSDGELLDVMILATALAECLLLEMGVLLRKEI